MTVVNANVIGLGDGDQRVFLPDNRRWTIDEIRSLVEIFAPFPQRAFGWIDSSFEDFVVSELPRQVWPREPGRRQ